MIGRRYAYTMGPAGVLNSFAMSAYVFFVLMMSLRFIIDAIEHPMIDASYPFNSL